MSKKVVLGVDFGSTRSCVAINIDGEVQVIKSINNTSTIPSCVAFANNGRDICVGYEAEEQALYNPEYTIFDIKDIMGKSYSDAQLKAEKNNRRFILSNDGSNKPQVVVSEMDGYSKAYSIEQVASYVFSELKFMAEDFLKINYESKFNIIDAVITVPVSFNKSQRQSIFNAATIAGLNILKILNEPTSLLFAYGLPDKYDKEMKVLVCDLRETSFYVSIVSIKEDECIVKAISEEPALCNQDFISILVRYCLEGLPYNVLGDSLAIRRLQNACKQAVENLSSKDYTSIDIDCISKGINFEMEITKGEFEDFTGSLYNKIVDPINQVLNGLDTEKDIVDEIILVGGGIWIPKAKRILKEYFKEASICCDVNPEEAIALGAATFAGNVTKYKTFEEVCPECFESTTIDLFLGSLPEIKNESNLKELENHEITIKKEQEIDATISSDNSNETILKANGINFQRSNNKDLPGSNSSIGGEKGRKFAPYDKRLNITKATLESDNTNLNGKMAKQTRLENGTKDGTARDIHDVKSNPTKIKVEKKSTKEILNLENKNNFNEDASHSSPKVDRESKNRKDSVNKKRLLAEIDGSEKFDCAEDLKKHNSGKDDEGFYKPKYCSDALNKINSSSLKFKENKEGQSLLIAKKKSNDQTITYAVTNGSTQSTTIAYSKSSGSDEKKINIGKYGKKIFDHDELLVPNLSAGNNSFNHSGLKHESEGIQKILNSIYSTTKFSVEGQTDENCEIENSTGSKQMLCDNIENLSFMPLKLPSLTKSECYLEHTRKSEVYERVSLSIGVRLASGESCIIIPKNSNLPFSGSINFTTAIHLQRDFIIGLYAGERYMANDNFYLGDLNILNITPGFERCHVYELNFNLGNDGVVKIEVVQRSTRFCTSGRINLLLYKFGSYEHKILLNKSPAFELIDKDLKSSVEMRDHLLKVAYSIKRFSNIRKVKTEDENKLFGLASKVISNYSEEVNKSKEEYETLCNELLSNATEVSKKTSIDIKSIKDDLPKFNLKPAILGTGKRYR